MRSSWILSNERVWKKNLHFYIEGIADSTAEDAGDPGYQDASNTEKKISTSSQENASSTDENKTENKPQPDTVSTDSGVSMDSGISSGNSEGEVDTELVYEKPKHLNQ